MTHADAERLCMAAKLPPLRLVLEDADTFTVDVAPLTLHMDAIQRTCVAGLSVSVRHIRGVTTVRFTQKGR